MILHDLLFELGTEELPSGAVKPLSEALAKFIDDALTAAGIVHGNVHSFATPRRLAVLVLDVSDMRAEECVSRRGPAVSQSLDEHQKPLPALIGFAKSCGVSVEALKKIQTDKGEWWSYEFVKEPVATRELLPSIITKAVAQLPVAKPMRWGDSDIEFTRPVHWAVLLFGDEAIRAPIMGVTAGRHSYGHRFHHPESVLIETPRDYESALKKAYVIADFDVRQALIVQQITKVSEKLRLQPIVPPALLDEVTSIVEWPNALLANFDVSFLDVPAEALIAAMQVHQKSFALRDEQGQLSPHFITIANIESKEPHRVILGNEKVMHARLSDAAFFYRQDKKTPLAERVGATQHVVFQMKLGTIADKTTRMSALLELFLEPLGINKQEALRAALLSKCDLLTGMVGEFPELQGLMGYYYALNDGEASDVAVALNEQYMPRFALDELPKSSLGLALSLVDRLDTLVGLFAIGQKPTGVKDPFKLRRHALAVVRMLMVIPKPLRLTTLIEAMGDIYSDVLLVTPTSMLELRSFILERMQSLYQAEGIPSEFVAAVRARQDDCLFDVNKRIHALLAFVEAPQSQSLSSISKRVTNLLQHATSIKTEGKVDVSLFIEPAEHELFAAIEQVECLVAERYDKGDYGFILNQLASLEVPVDTFFETVLVMVESQSIKENRLLLLARLQALLQSVADISLLGQ